MNRILAAVAVLLWAVGCGKAAEDEFRNALPGPEAVEIQMTDSSQGQGLSDSQQQGLQTSNFYVVTVGATAIINVGVVSVLNLVKNITEHTPTSLSGNAAVWGPHTQPLWRNEWQLTVERTAPLTYAYKLEGRAKADSSAAFVTVLSGTHTVAVDDNGARLENYGQGEFLVDWNAASALPDRDNNQGTAKVVYARASADAASQVTVDFTQVKDGFSSLPVDATYEYSQTPGGGGEFEFAVHKNIDIDLLRPQPEVLSIKSRWNAQGAGRADVKATGGELLTEATISECWDASFASTFLDVSYDAGLNYGVAASACVFAEASFASF